MAGPQKTVSLTPGLRALLDTTSERWLINAVEGWQAEDTAGNRRDPGWFHPSDLSHTCDAYLAFAFLGAPKRKDTDPRKRRVLDNGLSRDADWKRYLRESGLSIVPRGVGADCPGCGWKNADGRHICIPEVRVRGEFDDLVQNQYTKEHRIFEFKTKNDNLWKKLAAPDPDHIVQVQPYMVARALINTDIVYENKDNQELKAFTIAFDRELWQSTIERIQRIIDMLANGYSPDRVPEPFETSCTFYPICATSHFPDMVERYKQERGIA